MALKKQKDACNKTSTKRSLVSINGLCEDGILGNLYQDMFPGDNRRGSFKESESDKKTKKSNNFKHFFEPNYCVIVSISGI